MNWLRYTCCKQVRIVFPRLRTLEYSIAQENEGRCYGIKNKDW
nr:MAG TPA: hypothetical protein [Bacteriophage sp.]